MKRILITTIFFFGLALSLMNANASEKAELHWNLCEESSQVVLKKLGLRVKDFEQRSVSYHDTWDEGLGDYVNYSHGVVLRVRQFDHSAISTVKLKFDSLPEFSSEWLEHEGFKCEKDIYAQRESLYCSLSEKSFEFTQVQKRFLREMSYDISWDDLVEYGPAVNKVWSLKSDKKIPKFDLEELTLKDGTLVLELSTKTTLSSASAEHLRISSWIAARGIEICELQEPKTKLFLKSYSRRLSQ